MVAVVELALVKTGFALTVKLSEFEDVEELIFESPAYVAETA
jgi:hypothetical protein